MTVYCPCGRGGAEPLGTALPDGERTDEFMKKTAIRLMLYGAIALLALLGAAVFFWFAPMMAQECLRMYPELARLYAPGLAFCGWIALLCYGMLFLFAGVARRVLRGDSFCGENARAFRRMGALALLAMLSMPVVQLIFGVANVDSGPGVLLLTVAGFMGFLAVALLLFPLAGLVDQAAKLQDENALTI